MTSLFDNIPSIDDTKNYLDDYVGEGKKFKDAQELAKAKAMSDQFIEQLKTEQAELRKDYLSLREEYQARQALEELVDQLKGQQTSNDLPPVNDVPPPASLKAEDIESLVSKKLQEADMTRRQNENFNNVQAKLKERYGPNYSDVLKNQISTLGLTEEFAEDLARNHPAVFSKTFGLETPARQDTFQAPPHSSQRPFSPSDNKRDWNFYENMRRDKPNEYWNPKTQLQMYRDKETLGDAFGNPM